jgi:copper resistance protein B
MRTVQPTRQKETMTMRNGAALFAIVVVAFAARPAFAQEQKTDDPHAGHAMMSAPAKPSNQVGNVAGKERDMSRMNGPAAMEIGSMQGGSMQGGSAPPDARDPHAYAGGFEFGPDRLGLADEHSMGSLLVEGLEAARTNGNTSTDYDLQAWYGRTYDRAVLKAEGEYDGGKLEEARTELLWGHAIAAFWDTQLGVRYDNGEGPDRGWLAFGVQGLAPYWFEVEATGYLGERGRTALRLDASYELLLTQKLILQPRVETDIYGKRDIGRGLGSGLAELSAALRLRYEIRRELAPYVGVEWVRKFGDTEDLARAAGEDASQTRFVAGVRFWF